MEQRSIAHLYDLQVATDQGFTNVVFSSSHLTDVNLREQANKTETSAFPDPREFTRLCAACRLAAGRHHVLLAGRRQDDGADSENGSGLELHCWHGAASAATTPARRRRHRALCVDFDQRPRRMGRVSDSSAAGGSKLQHANASAAKLSAALPNPTHYFELTFNAEGGRPYHLWLRGRADGDSSSNDSVFVQFSGSVIQGSATPTWRIGTTSATEVNLEDCSSCGLAAWGWQDNGWGSATTMGTRVYFKRRARRQFGSDERGWLLH